MFLKTGIPNLDKMLGGGVKRQSNVLISAYPGVENIPFALQFLNTRLNQGDHVLYFVNNKKPDAVRRMMKNFGWNLSFHEKKKRFAFIDAYSCLFGLRSSEKFSVKDYDSPEDIRKTVKKAVSDFHNENTIVIFDSLSHLIDFCRSSEGTFESLKKSLLDIKKTGASFFLFTSWSYDKKTIDQLNSSFECIIDLRAVERNIILRKYFSIKKAAWIKKLQKKDIPFKIIQPGGIKAYIPKILVTGPYNAGKTSLIHSVSTRAVSVDRLGTTIALDHGHVDYGGFAVDLWGTPGQERFDPILELLGSESLGVIVVIDSTDPQGFARARQMLELTKTESLPLVIAANKSNLKDALSPDQIRKKLDASEDIPIIPVSAKKPKKAKKGMPCELKDQDVSRIISTLFEMVI